MQQPCYIDEDITRKVNVNASTFDERIGRKAFF